VGGIPDGCDILWTVPLTLQYLRRKLRDGVASLEHTPLADKLAAGQLDPVPVGAKGYPPGFLPTQQLAYAACVEPGLHAVWGPPGTGKTHVLARAIEDLVRAGRRVLLVSTANVAVDNALKEVIRHLAPEPGTVIRVGPPHLQELASNDDVQLHRLAARKTEEVDMERRRVQDQLGRLADADDELRRLDEALANYDHQSYLAAQRRAANSRDLGALEPKLRLAEADHHRSAAELRSAQDAVEQLRAMAQRFAPQRAALTRARDLENQLAAQHQQLAIERLRVENLKFQHDHSTSGWIRRGANGGSCAVRKKACSSSRNTSTASARRWRRSSSRLVPKLIRSPKRSCTASTNARPRRKRILPTPRVTVPSTRGG
jgi:hypothetical protein